MARTLTVLTPENIPLHLELAGLGSRFAALLIDLVILSTALLIVAIVGVASQFAMTSVGMEDFGRAVLIVALFVVFFGYFIFFEALWNGQTPGKKALGLRVLCDGGFPLTVPAAAVRNLVRLADLLPGFFGVGALAVFLHPEHRRLGDLAAGTVVIRESPLERLRFGPEGPRGALDLLPASLRLEPGVRDPREALSAAEIALMRRFALQLWQMRADDAERFAYRLVAPRAERLNLNFAPGVAPRYTELVLLLVRDADRPRE